MLFLLLSTFVSLSRSQSFSYAWASSSSERNVRVVFDGSSCAGYGRVEIWRNNAWNALSDCSSRQFLSTEANAVCYQVGFTSGYFGYRFYTSTSVPTALKGGSTTPASRTYAGSMLCSSRSTGQFCDGCSISTSTSTSKCSSSIYRSTSESASSPGMWSGSRVYNRDVFVNCAGIISSSQGSCNVVTGTSNLYSSAQSPTAGQCNLSGSSTTAGDVVGAIVGIIIAICYCCCCLGAIGFFFFGGTLAICECLRPRSRPAPATGMVVTTVATTQSSQVTQSEGYGQTTNATAVGYGQPVGQPVQYGAAPGYETAPTQGYPPTQQGYAQQGYAQPVAVAGAPGYPPAGGYAPGYAPTGGAAPGYGQPAPGGPPAYAPAGGAAPGYAPQNPPPY